VVRSAARRRVRAVAMREASGGGGMRLGMSARSHGLEGVGRVCVRRANWSCEARSWRTWLGGILW